MTTYYLDASAGIDGDGSSGSPWNTFASALTGASAGDTVLCQGTETRSADLVPSVSGDTTTGPIKYLGCDASWTPGAAQFVLDADVNAISIMDLATNKPENLWFENFTFKKGTHCIEATAAVYNNLFKQCIFELSTNNLWHYGYACDNVFYQCVFRNGNFAFYGVGGKCFFCRFESIGTWSNQSNQLFYGCLFTQSGLSLSTYDGPVLINCVSDDAPGDAFNCNPERRIIIMGCRIGNAGGYAIAESASTGAAEATTLEMFNVFYNNTNGNIESLAMNSLGGSSEAANATEWGCSSDYNLTASAIQRSVAVNLNWDA